MNSKANRVALIPARLESERLPEKLLLPLGGVPIIVKTYQAVLETALFDKVVIICNHTRLSDVLTHYGCEHILDNRPFDSGTDRIAHQLSNFPHEYIINVQGDEPFTKKSDLDRLLEIFDNQEVEIATLKCSINNNLDVANPNVVKVVTNDAGRALYFSRSVIPYHRDIQVSVRYYKHVGIYGYRRDVLLALSQTKPSQLERVEKLENLRMIEKNMYVAVAEIGEVPISIDTAEDYEKAIRLLGGI